VAGYVAATEDKGTFPAVPQLLGLPMEQARTVVRNTIYAHEGGRPFFTLNIASGEKGRVLRQFPAAKMMPKSIGDNVIQVWLSDGESA
jgi:hypothetical protein